MHDRSKASPLPCGRQRKSCRKCLDRNLTSNILLISDLISFYLLMAALPDNLRSCFEPIIAVDSATCGQATLDIGSGLIHSRFATTHGRIAALRSFEQGIRATLSAFRSGGLACSGGRTVASTGATGALLHRRDDAGRGGCPDHPRPACRGRWLASTCVCRPAGRDLGEQVSASDPSTLSTALIRRIQVEPSRYPAGSVTSERRNMRDRRRRDPGRSPTSSAATGFGEARRLPFPISDGLLARHPLMEELICPPPAVHESVPSTERCCAAPRSWV